MAMAFLPILEKLPIIFVSTHGAYSLKLENTPFRIPPNTYVFETATIGESTLTDIDEPLWTLSQGVNRAAFMAYLRGQVNPSDPTFRPEFAEVFQNMHFYGPGDLMYPRILILGGGRFNEKTTCRVGFGNMGFYKFDLGTNFSFPEDGRAPAKESLVFDSLRTKMIEDDDNWITTTEFINDIVPKDEGSIIIFSSCATIEDSKNAGVAAIERRQREQNLLQMVWTTAGPGGPGVDPKKRQKHPKYHFVNEGAAEPAEFHPSALGNAHGFTVVSNEKERGAPPPPRVQQKGVAYYYKTNSGSFLPLKNEKNGLFFSEAKARELAKGRNLYYANAKGSMTRMGGRRKLSKRSNKTSKRK